MTIIASTLRSQPQRAIETATRILLDVGFDTLALAQPLYLHDWELLRPLLPRESVLTAALFTPLPRGLQPGESCPFGLGSLRPEEKRDAEKYGPSTITFADENGIPFVHLPCVELDTPGPGALEPEEVQARFDSYLCTVDHLLSVADRYPVELAITPARSRVEMPDADQTALCLAEFRGAPLRVWPDTGRHALTAREEPETAPPWKRFEPIAGVTLRDLDEEGKFCLPDQGSLDWPELIRQLDEVSRWLVDARLPCDADHVAPTLEFLRRLLEPETRDPLFPGRSF